MDLSLGTLSLMQGCVPVSHYWWRSMEMGYDEGFDSRTSEMQIQISAGVKFYALLLENATVFFVSPSLSLSFFFLFLFNCLLSFLLNKIVTGLVIYGNFQRTLISKFYSSNVSFLREANFNDFGKVIFASKTAAGGGHSDM